MFPVEYLENSNKYGGEKESNYAIILSPTEKHY